MVRDRNLSVVEGTSNLDEEINLADIFGNIWRQRGLVLGFILLFALLSLIYHFAKASFSSPERVDYSVSLTFLNEKGTYPNGTTFGLRDLISTLVVQDVIEQMGLDISAEKLSRALDVRSSNSLLDITETRLVSFISAQKTPADIRLAAENELKIMREQTASSLTVSIDLDLAGLTAREGEAVLRNVMDSWAQLSIEKGLTNADINRPAKPFVSDDKLTIIDKYDNASNYFASLNAAAEALARLPGSNSLVVKGYTLDDIRRELKTLNDTEISPLREFAYSKAGELAASNPAIHVRLFSRQRLLDLEHQRITKLIASYDSVLTLLNQTAANDSSSSGAMRQNNVGAQMDQSFLDSMLDLGSKLGSVEIRQQLFERRTNAMEELLNLEKELAILKSTKAEAHAGNIKAEEILIKSIGDIEKGLNGLREQLDQLIVMYRNQTLQSNGRMYVADAVPVARGSYMVSAKAALHLALAIVLGGMIGVVVALVRSAVLRNNLTSGQQK